LDGLYKRVVENLKKAAGDTDGLKTEIDKRFTMPYYPHVSLYYGDVSMETREAIIEGLVRRGTVEMAYGHPPVTVAGVDGGFHVAEIWIAECEGPVETWKILEKIKIAR